MLPITAICAFCGLDGWGKQLVFPYPKINKKLHSSLMECSICEEVIHPECVRKMCPDIEGKVNKKSSNSWVCPKCCKDGEMPYKYQHVQSTGPTSMECRTPNSSVKHVQSVDGPPLSECIMPSNSEKHLQSVAGPSSSEYKTPKSLKKGVDSVAAPSYSFEKCIKNLANLSLSETRTPYSLKKNAQELAGYSPSECKTPFSSEKHVQSVAGPSSSEFKSPYSSEKPVQSVADTTLSEIRTPYSLKKNAQKLAGYSSSEFRTPYSLKKGDQSVAGPSSTELTPNSSEKGVQSVADPSSSEFKTPYSSEKSIQSLISPSSLEFKTPYSSEKCVQSVAGPSSSEFKTPYSSEKHVQSVISPSSLEFKTPYSSEKCVQIVAGPSSSEFRTHYCSEKPVQSVADPSSSEFSTPYTLEKRALAGHDNSDALSGDNCNSEFPPVKKCKRKGEDHSLVGCWSGDNCNDRYTLNGNGAASKKSNESDNLSNDEAEIAERRRQLAYKIISNTTKTLRKPMYAIRPAPIKSKKYTRPMVEVEALLYVFKYLTPFDLARCALVCRDWSNVSTNPSLWERMDLSNKTLSRECFMNIVRKQPVTLVLDWTVVSKQHVAWLIARLPQMRALSLQGCSWLAASALRTCSCPPLTFLDLSFLRDLNDVSLCNLLGPPIDTRPGVIDTQSSPLRHLQTLKLAGCDVSELSLRYVLQVLPKLSSLDLSSCPKLTDAGVALLSTYPAPTVNTLISLNVAGCRLLTEKSLEYLTRCSSLKNIDMRHISQISSKAIQHYATESFQMAVTDDKLIGKVT